MTEIGRKRTRSSAPSSLSDAISQGDGRPMQRERKRTPKAGRGENGASSTLGESAVRFLDELAESIAKGDDLQSALLAVVEALPANDLRNDLEDHFRAAVSHLAEKRKQIASLAAALQPDDQRLQNGPRYEPKPAFSVSLPAVPPIDSLRSVTDVQKAIFHLACGFRSAVTDQALDELQHTSLPMAGLSDLLGRVQLASVFQSPALVAIEDVLLSRLVAMLKPMTDGDDRTRRLHIYLKILFANKPFRQIAAVLGLPGLDAGSLSAKSLEFLAGLFFQAVAAARKPTLDAKDLSTCLLALNKCLRLSRQFHASADYESFSLQVQKTASGLPKLVLRSALPVVRSLGWINRLQSSSEGFLLSFGATEVGRLRDFLQAQRKAGTPETPFSEHPDDALFAMDRADEEGFLDDGLDANVDGLADAAASNVEASLGLDADAGVGIDSDSDDETDALDAAVASIVQLPGRRKRPGAFAAGESRSMDERPLEEDYFQSLDVALGAGASQDRGADGEE